MKYKLSDYKGKHFIIQDELTEEFDYPYIFEEISDEQLTDKFLQVHVETSIYYGIPAYCGKNQELKERIKKFEEEYEKRENTSMV